MKALKDTLVAGTVGIAGALALGLPSQAQPASTAAPSTAQASDMTDAEVRKVDKPNRKITLKHGAIKNLDMPPMTMVFQVKDAAMLDKLQPGDKVRFKAAKDAGKYIVTAIQPVKRSGAVNGGAGIDPGQAAFSVSAAPATPRK